MTLVLPYGSDQIGGKPQFSRASGHNMPCVFEGQSLDFESALMTADWSSDMNDYETSADDFCTQAPSSDADLKRKDPPSAHDAHPKKLRLEDRPSDESDVVASLPSPPSTTEEEEEDEEDPVPRRRGPQMWNSRQRWKDERKRVLKLSMTKLAEIDDVELCLHRSVVLNNTVRRLHADIRGERQAKLRHRQQKMDFFQRADRPRPQEDESSCDEMFGVSEDFLRVTIPDRRVSSPVPSEMDTSPGCKSSGRTLPSCDSPADSAPACSPSPHRTGDGPASPRRLVGTQCATQFRTTCEPGAEGSFPPRVPILDSVVYHSLLASLESS